MICLIAHVVRLKDLGCRMGGLCCYHWVGCLCTWADGTEWTWQLSTGYEELISAAQSGSEAEAEAAVPGKQSTASSVKEGPAYNSPGQNPPETTCLTGAAELLWSQ